jgi:hypothetical protein
VAAVGELLCWFLPGIDMAFMPYMGKKSCALGARTSGWASLLPHAIFDDECALLSLREKSTRATVIIDSLDRVVLEDESCFAITMGRLPNGDSGAWGSPARHCGCDVIAPSGKSKKLQVVNTFLAKRHACTAQQVLFRLPDHFALGAGGYLCSLYCTTGHNNGSKEKDAESFHNDLYQVTKQSCKPGPAAIHSFKQVRKRICYLYCSLNPLERYIY